MIKRFLRDVARVARVVIYDPEVQREGKALFVLVAVRVALALGASAQMVEIIRAFIGA
jgi:hypothetical protein